MKMFGKLRQLQERASGAAKGFYDKGIAFYEKTKPKIKEELEKVVKNIANPASEKTATEGQQKVRNEGLRTPTNFQPKKSATSPNIQQSNNRRTSAEEVAESVQNSVAKQMILQKRPRLVKPSSFNIVKPSIATQSKNEKSLGRQRSKKRLVIKLAPNFTAVAKKDTNVKLQTPKAFANESKTRSASTAPKPAPRTVRTAPKPVPRTAPKPKPRTDIDKKSRPEVPPRPKRAAIKAAREDREFAEYFEQVANDLCAELMRELPGGSQAIELDPKNPEDVQKLQKFLEKERQIKQQQQKQKKSKK